MHDVLEDSDHTPESLIDVLRLDTLGDADLERVRKYHAAWKVLDNRG